MLNIGAGGDLSSREATLRVLSAMKVFTTVFGMGTGGFLSLCYQQNFSYTGSCIMNALAGVKNGLRRARRFATVDDRRFKSMIWQAECKDNQYSSCEICFANFYVALVRFRNCPPNSSFAVHCSHTSAPTCSLDASRRNSLRCRFQEKPSSD